MTAYSIATSAVLDYHQESGDSPTLIKYALNIDSKVQCAAAVEGSRVLWGSRGQEQGSERERPWVPPSLDFIGWDERLGGGFEFGNSNESQVSRIPGRVLH